jgi:hypothetical protein
MLTLLLQVFLLLVAEMALFMLLIIPLPFAIRRKMFTYVSQEAPRQDKKPIVEEKSLRLTHAPASSPKTRSWPRSNTA